MAFSCSLGFEKQFSTEWCYFMPFHAIFLPIWDENIVKILKLCSELMREKVVPCLSVYNSSSSCTLVAFQCFSVCRRCHLSPSFPKMVQEEDPVEGPQPTLLMGSRGLFWVKPLCSHSCSALQGFTHVPTCSQPSLAPQMPSYPHFHKGLDTLLFSPDAHKLADFQRQGLYPAECCAFRVASSLSVGRKLFFGAVTL